MGMFVFLREPQMKEIPRYIGRAFANNNFIKIILKVCGKKISFNLIAFAAPEELALHASGSLTESRWVILEPSVELVIV